MTRCRLVADGGLTALDGSVGAFRDGPAAADIGKASADDDMVNPGRDNDPVSDDNTGSGRSVCLFVRLTADRPYDRGVLREGHPPPADDTGSSGWGRSIS